MLVNSNRRKPPLLTFLSIISLPLPPPLQVHPSGRYQFNTVIHILQHTQGMGSLFRMSYPFIYLHCTLTHVYTLLPP